MYVPQGCGAGPSVAGVGSAPEQHHQRFHWLTLHKLGHPFPFAQKLRDTCQKWLLAERRGTEEVIDLVVLEQFVTQQLEGMVKWVECH